jgi:hypothetical protein
MKIYVPFASFAKAKTRKRERKKISESSSKLIRVLIKFSECDEFPSVDDGFLLRFIIVNLHICLL